MSQYGKYLFAGWQIFITFATELLDSNEYIIIPPMKKTCLVISVLIAMAATSCVTQQKMAYLKNVDATLTDSINKHYNPIVEPKVVVGDHLFITVAAQDADAAAPFNLPTQVFMTPGSETAATTPSLQYYTVDPEGNINFPILGKLHLAGLKKSEAVTYITEKLQLALRDPIVNIQFLSYNITVMGEVNRPGKYQIRNERVTLLDALAMAGDMTPYGKRDNILVTRETDGKLEFVRLNINDASILTSPYFFLQQNDVVYVEPNKVRALASQNISLYLSMVTTLASMATVIVSVVNTSN